MREQLLQEITQCERLLIGIGREWEKNGNSGIEEAYEALSRLIKGKDYFIVTTVTDGEIFHTSLEAERIVAPCGNETWRQCSKSCAKDIWEPGEIPDDICPHCGAPLTGNTIAAENYIEEGYLPQWKRYTAWLSGTLNKNLLVLELGVGFTAPTVIRWPFEKTALYNKKARMYRVHERLFQIPPELKEKAEAVAENSSAFFRNL